MIHLREARLTDAEGIADVVKDVWEQAILPDVCSAQIEDDTRALWVATEDGEVAGFVSAFPTTDRVGRRRWEIDLLAVRRASQGRGLGTRLIRRVCEAAQRHDVSLARALIGVESVPSQRAFERAGFTTDGRVHKLFLWSPAPGGEARPHPCPGRKVHPPLAVGHGGRGI